MNKPNKTKKAKTLDMESHDDRLSIEFSNQVLELVDKDDISILEAIAELCEVYEIAEEDIKSLLTPKLIAVLHTQAEDAHLLKTNTRTGRLF